MCSLQFRRGPEQADTTIWTAGLWIHGRVTGRGSTVSIDSGDLDRHESSQGRPLT